MTFVPSSPSLFLASDTRVSELIKGMSPATTMMPSTPIFFSSKSSSMIESALISLIGISLNISMLRLPTTAAESCEAALPVKLLFRTSTHFGVPTMRSDAIRMQSMKPSPWFRKSNSFLSRLMPNSMIFFSVPIFANIIADSMSKLLPRTLHSESELLARSDASRIASTGPRACF